MATLLGAHAVPIEFQDCSQKYVESVCKVMIPHAARRKLAQFVDVFCDQGAFTAKETEQIFEAAQNRGLSVRLHVGQLSETALAPFWRFHPASFDHMDHVNEDDVSRLAKQNTVVTLVPGANYFLGLKQYPDARRFIDAGVPVALDTVYALLEEIGSVPSASAAMRHVEELARDPSRRWQLLGLPQPGEKPNASKKPGSKRNRKSGGAAA